MQLTEISHNPKHDWDHDCLSKSTIHTIDWNSPQSIVTNVQPFVRYDINEVAQLNEMTYKEVATMIDGNFLNQTVRSDQLKSVNYKDIDGDTMVFYVPSSEVEDNGINYATLVKFDQWEEIGTDTELTVAEKARLLLWIGDIRLHCTCPSFLFWGYQYLLTVMDASVFPEERKPVKKNPGERGIVCKHLNRVLRVLPFHSGQIARELKSQYG